MKKILSWLLAAAILLCLCPVAKAEAVTEIHTVEDLLAMAHDPGAHYVLMADLDLTGVDWLPVDLTGGSFDGNGYSILNLTITQVGLQRGVSYDGNRIEYDTVFAGFFGILRDAKVTGLNLVNVRAVVENDSPCFLGGIAGAVYDSALTDCSVSGSLELRAWDRMFGLGGLAGYGYGTMERCKGDMTLICVDTGVDTLDEQFLGGAYAAGYIDVVDCEIVLDAYVSEYGYVHNGGLIGMVMQYPFRTGSNGKLTGNTLRGKITFFECNEDRRAYCEAYVGETLSSSYTRKNNTADFQRDERFTYEELRPEVCDNPVYSETTVEPDCDSYGYTEYVCQDCGYSYTDAYTLFRHTVTTWTVTEEPTTEKEGSSVGYCDGCGLEMIRTEEKLEPVPTETAVPTETEVPTEPEPPVQEGNAQRETSVGRFILPAAAAFFVLMVPVVCRRKKGKYQK